MRVVDKYGNVVEVASRFSFSKEQVEAMRATVRRSLVVRLRAKGYPYHVVARIVGVSTSGARLIDKAVSDADRRVLKDLEL